MSTGDLPWFRFYPSDWLGGTRGMSATEAGIYITLIANMYDRMEPLPEDYDRLARLCGTTKSALKKTIKTLIEDKKIVRIEGGFWTDQFKKWDKFSVRQKLSTDLRQEVFNREGYRCTYCGDENGPFHIDHIFPLALGGLDSSENLTVACRSCNLRKGAKTLEEWRLMQ